MPTSQQPSDWSLWAEFCNKTGREKKWGDKIGEMLQDEGILPCRFALDVGCGTGEFTETISRYTPTVEGIDIVDIRKTCSFNFRLLGLEEFAEMGIGTPDVVLLKQSYHLLSQPDIVHLGFPNSTLVVAQMPQPHWDDNPSWTRRPLNARLNADAFIQNGRQTEVIRLRQAYSIETTLLARMFLCGYTSDLRRLSSAERRTIWKTLEPSYQNGRFNDVLDLIIARPVGTMGG